MTTDTKHQGSIYLAHHLATMVERDERPSIVSGGRLWEVQAVTYVTGQGFRFQLGRSGVQAFTIWLDRTQPIEVVTAPPIVEDVVESEGTDWAARFVAQVKAPAVLVVTGDHTWTEVHNRLAGELVSARPGEPVEYDDADLADVDYDDDSLAEFELDRAENAYLDARMGW
jgi:hypothetical protein